MKYNLPKEFIDRYELFISSDFMYDIPNYSKSDYWKHHASEVEINIDSHEIQTKGKSGFYVPNKYNPISFVKKVIKIFFENPFIFYDLVRKKLGIPINGIKMMSYERAFDKVMQSHEITQPQLSKYRINFKKISEQDYTFSSVIQCKQDYSNYCSQPFNDHILISYFYMNILNFYTNLNMIESPVILEIGGGNGNLSSVLKWHTKNSTIIDVDLPETISHSILYINDLFPDAKIIMPNEIYKVKNINDYDFIFLTPSQVDLIEDSSIDIAINSHSFQEMTSEQINEYFNLIQRALKNNSFFFTANRVEKIPSGMDSYEKETKTLPIRFSDYPWNKSNEILVHEICRLFRIVQLDPISSRLEKIKK